MHKLRWWLLFGALLPWLAQAQTFLTVGQTGLQLDLQPVTVTAVGARYLAFQPLVSRRQAWLQQAQHPERWLGQQVAFLPTMAGAVPMVDIRAQGQPVAPGTLDEMVGTVTQVRETPATVPQLPLQLTVTLANGQAVEVGGDILQVPGLVPVAKLLQLDQRYTGHTFTYAARWWYVAGAPLQSAPGPFLKTVRVTGVGLSTSLAEPYRLNLEDSQGNRGYIAVSDAFNTGPTPTPHRASAVLLTAAEMTQLNLTPERLRAVKAQQVTLGMTPAQALLAWGWPWYVEQAGTQTVWRYSQAQQLRFEQDQLVGMTAAVMLR